MVEERCMVVKVLEITSRSSSRMKKKIVYYENDQQDALHRLNLLFQVSSTCFGRCLHPSSGAFAVSGSIHPSRCRLVSWMSGN